MYTPIDRSRQAELKNILFLSLFGLLFTWKNKKTTVGNSSSTFEIKPWWTFKKRSE